MRVNVKFFLTGLPIAAFAATGNVIVGIAKIYKHVIPHIFYNFKGVSRESLTVSHTLMSGVNAKEPIETIGFFKSY